MTNIANKRLSVNLLVNANINGEAFKVVGKSLGVVGSGRISATVGTAHSIPEGFHLSLLSYVLLTGQPSMSLVTQGCTNPFVSTGGVYEASRSLDLGTKGELNTRYKVERDGEGLAATFDITGQVQVPEFVSIAPAIETWTPTGPGKIAGHFTMVWRAQDGTYVKGEAETCYSLPTDEVLSGVQYRDIRIDFDCEDGCLHQNERITLFSSILLDKVI